MLSEKIIFQSAGSMTVSAIALFLIIFLGRLYYKKPEFHFLGWAIALSFSLSIYSAAVVVQYNAPGSTLNQFSERIQYTSFLFIIQSLFGFTFSYLSLNGGKYHQIFGVFHGFLFIVL